MTFWLNHVTIDATGAGSHTVDPSNPTAIGTVVDGSAFTPTAGRLLVLVAAGPVTSGTPTGWTLPSGGSAVSTDGLYVFRKTAAGSDTAVIGHNSAAYHVIFDIYEFDSAASFGSSTASAGAASGATVTLSGLTGGNLIMAPICSPGAAGAFTYTGATKTYDALAGDAMSRYAIANIYSSSSSVGVAATSATHEALVFSIAGLTNSQAASGTGSLSLSGTAGAVAPASAAGSLSLSSSAAAGLPASGSGALTLSASAGAAVGAPAAGSLSLSSSAGAAGSAAATGSITFGSTTEAAPLYTTDLSNIFNGLSLSWTAVATCKQATAAPPADTPTVVNKALPLPLPVLVKGRET